MEKYENIKKIALIFLVTIIIFASFFGVYKKEDYQVVNIIKNFKTGMEFAEKRVITLTVDDTVNTVIYDEEGNEIEDDGETEYTEENGYKTVEEKVNSDEILNLNNYKKTVSMLKKRLRKIGKYDYEISLNNETGEITIELPEDDDIDETISILNSIGAITIADSETEEVLMDNSDIKTAKVTYGSTDNTTITVYLELDFNKEGAKKLEEISQIYVKTEEETQTETDETTTTDEDDENIENTESDTDSEEETEDIKTIQIAIDGETYSQTYFGETMTTGVLYVPIQETEDVSEAQTYIDEVAKLVAIINNGPTEITYTLDSTTVETNITTQIIWLGTLILGFSLLIACIILMIKFKAEGIVATLLQIGYIAMLMLIVRYTNVVITIEGIVGLYLSAFLNYFFAYMMLKDIKDDKKLKGKTVLKFFIRTIPIYIIAVILSFIPYTKISSLGMTLVWGSITLYIYNILLAKNILED